MIAYGTAQERQKRLSKNASINLPSTTKQPDRAL
jgi:hypothetical protein